MTCPHPATTEALDHGTAVRCTFCGHRVWDIIDVPRWLGRYVKPQQTRYCPSRWLTEYWRRHQARRTG